MRLQRLIRPVRSALVANSRVLPKILAESIADLPQRRFIWQTVRVHYRPNTNHFIESALDLALPVRKRVERDRNIVAVRLCLGDHAAGELQEEQMDVDHPALRQIDEEQRIHCL